MSTRRTPGRTPGLVRASRKHNDKVFDELERGTIGHDLDRETPDADRLKGDNNDDSFDPQDHFDALKEFNRLAAIDKLEISADDYELPLDEDPLARGRQTHIDVRPDGDGDQVSTYSDFMQTWKNKLMTD